MTADSNPNVEPGEGGLARVVLASPGGGRAEVYLHGAHVTRWTTPGGRDVLYLSPRSRFAPGEAIRGGIPVIFPQFADQGPLPKHGFARTAQWRPDTVAADAATLVLTDTPETRALWDYSFRARLRVQLANHLFISLTVFNTGDRAFEFTCALHSYFRVGGIGQVAIGGLEGIRYRDKVAGGEDVQRESELRFRGETDRVYLNAPGILRIRDGGEGRTITVEKHGFADAVVWNPGAEKARGMDDLGEGTYRDFVCVEAACAGEPVRLEPGADWEGRQTIFAE